MIRCSSSVGYPIPGIVGASMSAVFPMDPGQRAIRPAYVRFVRSSKEDRDASIKAGHLVEVHNDVALICPPGGKDVVERDVPSWMEYLAYQEREGIIPQALRAYYKDMYQRWCQGQEMPPAGAPILGWQLLASSEQQRVIGANILTVEDLADASHMQMQEIGMGAPAMVAKAKNWLSVGQGQGAAAMEMESMQARLASQEKEIAMLREELEDRPRKRRVRSDKGIPRTRLLEDQPRSAREEIPAFENIEDAIYSTSDSSSRIP